MLGGLNLYGLLNDSFPKDDRDDYNNNNNNNNNNNGDDNHSNDNRGVKLNTLLHLVLRLRMSVDTSPNLHMSSQHGY